ncbi:MAG: alginate lyase family protein [Gammaproteobacteria bacterium]|nr:alginate lyase family protein [Gammaproteobacteria bacterium]MBT8051040.1 alginate lyase family protein [Gammaproteobacteria bacterium]MBT8056470.1 alginate lyase family protein [Gammaproteobacteria bacterium]NNJ80384.1 alginate lyase family protein [Xanthomonadales bacterium]
MTLLITIFGMGLSPRVTHSSTPASEDVQEACPSSGGFMMFWHADWLQRAKAAHSSPATRQSQALEAVICNADRALQRGPFSVTQKTGFPPDRDIHDYYSLAPYWWPDPDKENGLPYTRRDGQTNPERYGDGVDGWRRHEMVQDVTSLTLAGYFTEDPRYLDHAARQIRVWFLNPETAMNPNMNYSQYIPGRSSGRSYGIIDSRAFIRIIDAARLLHQSGALNDDDLASLKNWFGRFAAWLAESEHGRQEQKAENNHGTFYDLQLASFHWFSGDEDLAAEVIAAFTGKRVLMQIGQDGRMPRELARTRPFHYTLFNLQAMMNMALIADRLGMELLTIDREAGDRIHSAITFVSGGGHDWPLDRTHPDYMPLYELLRLHETMTGMDDFGASIPKSETAFDASVIHLLLPPRNQR